MTMRTERDAVEVLELLGLDDDPDTRTVVEVALTRAAAVMLAEALRLDGAGALDDAARWAAVVTVTRVAEVAGVFSGDPDRWWDGPEGRVVAEGTGALVGGVRR